MRNRNTLWLVGALVLFALGAWLMSSNRARDSRAKSHALEFPRMEQTAYERAQKRKKALMLKSIINGKAQRAQQQQDPFLVALGAIPQSDTTLIVEASALTQSPVGEMLINCLSQEEGAPLKMFEKEFGFNPVTAVDRIAMTKDGLLFSGDFQDAKWDTLRQQLKERRYGERATLFERGIDGGSDDAENSGFGVWNDELVMFSKHDAEQNEEIVDVLEGRMDYNDNAFPESETYGEIYGVMSVEDISQLFLEQQPELAARFRQAASKIALHVNTSSDVTIVADVTGENAQQVTDLAKSLGGALSLLRIKARADGDDKLAELLDHTNIRTSGDGFQLELALPLEMIRENLGDCAKAD